MQENGKRLREIVSASEPLLLRTSEEASAVPALAGGWSRKQLIGHLIDSAANNHQRFVRASLQGSVEMPGYAQDHWVQLEGYQEMSWSGLLALWTSYNYFLAHLIARLPEDKAGAACKIGDHQYTLEFLVADYIDHMVNHLRQIGAAH